MGARLYAGHVAGARAWAGVNMPVHRGGGRRSRTDQHHQDANGPQHVNNPRLIACPERE